MSRKSFTSTFATAILSLVTLALGCATDPASKPTTRTSDAALQDPYGNWSKIDDDNSTDVSGGGTGNLDKKGLKRDLDHFLLK